MILLIDNYDSFTYNLVQLIGELGQQRVMRVVRNDVHSADELTSWQPSHVIISPGPGTPDDAGVSIEVVYGERIWRVVSHCDGTFVIRGLPAGIYSLTPYRRGLRFEPDTTRVELPPVDDTRVHFVGYRAASE